MDFGHWKGSNLRQMSIDAEVKDEYDSYYDWASGYAHGHWAAARNTVFDICANPLHRLHRVPLYSTRIIDSASIVLRRFRRPAYSSHLAWIWHRYVP